MTQKPKEVFISYSTKDTDVAYALLNTLEAYGLDCWIAPRNIPQGAMWAEEIDNAIQNARVFVVIVSSHSVESRQVPKEIALAVTACESIFPFRIDDTGLQGTFRYYLSDYQFTDATTEPQEKMNELAAVICSSLGKPVPETPPAVPQAEKLQVDSNTSPSASAPPAAAKEESLKETIDRPRRSSVQTPAASQGPKSKKPLLIGAIAAVVVIGVILGIVFAGKGKKDNSSSVPASQAAVITVSPEKTDSTTTPAGTAASSDKAESAAVAESAAIEESTTQEISTETEESAETAESTANEESSAITESSDPAASETNETVADAGQAAMLIADIDCGVWEKIAYEDRGASTDINTVDLYYFGDGKIYTGVDEWLSGSALTFDTLLDSAEKYQLEVNTSYESSFDGSISDKSIGMTPIQIAPYMPSSNLNPLPEENPTGLSCEDCYPERYLFIHFTGTCQESPVKKSDVDTWVVYQKKYPLLNSRMLPALTGDWEDDMGNIWTFSMNDDRLSFSMTDSSGNVYHEKDYRITGAKDDKVNFFERICFVFEEYTTDRYAVLSFDGQTLQLLDESWDSYTLRRK